MEEGVKLAFVAGAAALLCGVLAFLTGMKIFSVGFALSLGLFVIGFITTLAGYASQQHDRQNEFRSLRKKREKPSDEKTV